MADKQGLKNFALNIKPLMMRLGTKPQKLNIDEQKTIIEFYLEVVHYLAQPES